ncbi:MAG: TonB-dependent receptor plug domain-containing protein, partial [Bacteroidota bacterium]
TVREAGSAEQLAYVQVLSAGGQTGTLSNAYGFFSLTLPEGQVEVSFVHPAYQVRTLLIQATEDTSIQVWLEPREFQTDTVAITSRQQPVGQPQLGKHIVPIQQLKAMPALLGEGDVLKGLQLLPGIQFGQEGTSGLFVRGGSPDQNLILLDDMPVYNVNHLFGFFSLFPPGVMKDVEVIKGGFPAQYGGRLSSVIRMQTKEGNLQAWKKEVSIGAISGQASVEGPLIKGKSSFFLAGRRSWLDLFLRPGTAIAYRREGINGFTTYDFHDVIGKVNYQLSDKDRLYVSVYTGRDVGRIKTELAEEMAPTYASDNQIRWGNITTSLRYQRVFGKKWFGQTVLGYTRYRFATVLSGSETDVGAIRPSQSIQLTQFSQIGDIILKQDMDYYPAPQHHLKFGTQLSRKVFQPDVDIVQSRFQQTVIDTSFNRVNYLGHTLSLYGSHDWHIFSRLKLNYGVRAELFTTDGISTPSLQPRLRLRWSVNDQWSVQAAYSYIQQYLHLLTNSGQGLPTDLWVPATSRIQPASSHQGVVGIYHEAPAGISASVELYYKNMSRVLEYKDGVSFLRSFENWEDAVIQGEGRSYGGEVFLHKPHGRTNGWVSYTLSWTDRQFEEINQNAWFPFRYDRRHLINVFVSHQLKRPGRSFSASWMYQSGARATIPTELAHTPYDLFTDLNGLANNFLSRFQTYGFGEVYGYASERNNYQMRPFHKLDVAYRMTREKKARKRTFSVGVYNLYARSNPYYVFLQRIGDGRLPVRGGRLQTTTRLVEYSMLLWIPYVSWTVAW